MTQPLNLCRQFKQSMIEFEEQLRRHPDAKAVEGAHKIIQRMRDANTMLDRAEKFILPVGGRLFNDAGYKGLDETQPLRLPYPVIALEFINKQEEGDDDYPVTCDKSIVLAVELSAAHKAKIGEDYDAGICVIPICHAGLRGETKRWHVMASIALPSTGYLLRDYPTKSGMPAVQFYKESAEFDDGDYANEAGALMSFLNILGCSNVHSEILKGREKSAKHCKDALPFDDYRVLTIGNEREQTTGSGHGGSHRSPREHLRRGHIVRPEGRRPFWRNATVVNAGVGGKVHKDYRVAA